jgi:DNA-binding GntR family transcriptional regulator
LSNCKEHDQFIELIKKKDRLGAAEILRDVHWSFLVQEKHIRRFYPNADGFDSL